MYNIIHIINVRSIIITYNYMSYTAYIKSRIVLGITFDRVRYFLISRRIVLGNAFTVVYMEDCNVCTRGIEKNRRYLKIGCDEERTKLIAGKITSEGGKQMTKGNLLGWAIEKVKQIRLSLYL